LKKGDLLFEAELKFNPGYFGSKFLVELTCFAITAFILLSVPEFMELGAVVIV
jgi:hypothetical protein